MSGNLLQLAKRDAKHFNNQGGFQETITLTNKDASFSLTLTGFATKHWINFDTDGNPADTKNAHVTLDENYLVSQGYVVRNAKGEVALKNHRISFPDSSGVMRSYIINRTLPDEILGLIVCILGDYTE